MGRMKKLIVLSPDPADYRVLHDLLRVYFPRLSFVEEEKGAVYWLTGRAQTSMSFQAAPGDELSADSGAVNAEVQTNDEGPALVMKIEKKEAPLEIRVAALKDGRLVDQQTEKIFAESFPEETEHRQRRLLRLCFQRVLVRLLVLQPSPWGILTGVRPTKIAHRLLDAGCSAEKTVAHLCQDYDLSRKRAELLTRVALYQRPYLAEQNESKLLSIYISIPFCPTRCHYCSFPAFSVERWGAQVPAYLSGLEKEIAAVGAALSGTGAKVRTVYLGGGTPTVLSAEQLAHLLATVERSFDFTGERELTVEGGRPDTLSEEKLRVLKAHQLSRLSINPQTMSDETLVRIGRQHTVQEIYEAYRLARKTGLPILNMDLIIGLPGEKGTVLEATLEKVLQLAPENITLHALAMKRAAYYRQEKIVLPVPSEGIQMMDLAHRRLQDAGYHPYYLYRQKEIFAHGENVGYTLPGKACLYNILMMEERQTILGFGVGSGSKLVNYADWTLENIYNPKDVQVYLERLEEIINRKVDKLLRIL